MSAAPGRAPAGGTPPFNVASPPTDCGPRSDHLLQHQDPRGGSHAQTVPRDAGSHDGLAVEPRNRKGHSENKTDPVFREDERFIEKESFFFRALLTRK